MIQGEAVPGISLRAYLDVLRRSWWVPVAGLCVGLIGAVGFLAVNPTQAQATASVVVNVISTDPFNPSRSASGLIDTAGEAQVASSYAVAARAAERLGMPFTPESVRRAVDVVGVSDTAILRISARADTARASQEIANAVAEEFLEFRSEQARTRIAQTLQQSSTRLEELRAELRAVDERIAAAPEGSREALAAQSERSVLTLQINAVASQAATTESIDTTGGIVLSPADRNPVRWSPRRGLVLASGGLAGFGLGVVAAYLVPSFARRVRSERDVAEATRAPVLGRLWGRRLAVPPSDVDLAELQAIRERLLADRRLSEQTGVIAVVDLTPAAALPDVAAGLAWALANAALPVELVALSADDAVAERLERSLRSGSTGAAVRVSRGGQAVSVPDLKTIVVRAGVGNEPISPELRQNVETARRSQIVVLAVPRTAPKAARLAAFRLADFTVLVVAPEATRLDAVREAAEDTQAMGSELLGAVLVPRRRSKD